MRRGKGEIGEGDADSGRQCKSGKYVEDPNILERYGLTGRKQPGVDYCIEEDEKVLFDKINNKGMKKNPWRVSVKSKAGRALPIAWK